MIKVSVIVPVYNTVEFLPKCLDSVLNQTLNDIEIICINDGSTDNSLEVLKQYATRFENILVLDQENKGAAAARNLGILHARGECISFIDSDDWIETDMLDCLFQAIDRNDADFAVCRFDLSDLGAKSSKKHGSKFSKADLEGKEILKDYFLQQNIFASSCNKIFRRSLFTDNNISFYEGIVNEDFLFICQICFWAGRVVFVEKVLYHVLMRTESVTRNMSTKNLDDALFVLEEERKFLYKNGGDEFYNEYFKAHYVTVICFILLMGLYRTSEFSFWRERIDNSQFYSSYKESYHLLDYKIRILFYLYRLRLLKFFKYIPLKKH